MKPEITAPGGKIYSVNGLVPGGKAAILKVLLGAIAVRVQAAISSETEAMTVC